MTEPKPTVSVHPPGEAALALLRQSGCTREDRQSGWVGPDGRRCWETDEALVALVARSKEPEPA